MKSDDSAKPAPAHGAGAAAAAARVTALSPDKLKELVSQLKRARNGPSNDWPPARADRSAPLPCSLQQERMWFFYARDKKAAAQHLPSAWRLEGALDVEAIRKAFAQLLARFEILRTTYEDTAAGLRQRVHAEFPSSFVVATVPDDAVAAAVNEEVSRPFDLAREPPIRAKLLRISESSHVLVLTVHHIATDGWSTGVMRQAFSELYAAARTGRDARLPVLAFQYADFAAWQRQWLTTPAAEAHLAYWRGQMGDKPPRLTLPKDHPATTAKARSESVVITIEKDVVDRAVALASAERATLFIVLVGAFDLLLSRYGNQDDVVIGTVLAGRTHAELETMVGVFFNALPLRTKIDRAKGFGQLLQQVKETTFHAQAHQELPYERALADLNVPRAAGERPGFQVMFALHNMQRETFALEGLDVRSEPVCAADQAAELMVNCVVQQEGKLLVGFEYDGNTVERATAERLADHFRTLLEAAIASPDEPVGKLPIANPAEQRRVLDWSRKDGSFVLDRDGQLAPIGVVGELHVPQEGGDIVVAGVQLARAGARARRLAGGELERIDTPPSTSKRHVAIAATFTADPVRDSLEYWLGQLGGELDVVFAPFGQIFQMLIDPTSPLATNIGGVNVLLLRLEDWPKAEVVKSTQELIAMLKGTAPTAGSPFVVVVTPSRSDAEPEVRSAEELLRAELASVRGVHVVAPNWVARYGVGEVFDPHAERLGAVPYTSETFAALGTTLARQIHGVTSPPYKVVAVDADETLWRGVVGEDGVTGIVIDGPRRALQQRLVALHDAGIQICIVSKNQEADVLAVFETRAAEMPLTRDHVTALRVNWLPKSGNLQSLARDLALGLDSFVFLDDNPVECAEVRAGCPEVLVIQVPKDGAELESLLDHVWAFDQHGPVTAEDKKRAAHYKQSVEREALREQTKSLGEFLEGLRLEVDITPMAADDVARVAQLTQRTNQFNATTVRRTEQELGAACAPRGALRSLVMRVRDRFGDYGLVGVALFEPRGGRLWVDTLLMSCRALGRGVEHRLLGHLGALAESEGLSGLDVPFIPSARNEPARAFLEAVCEDKPSGAGERTYRFSIATARGAFDRVFSQPAAPAPRDDAAPKAPAVSHAGRVSALQRAAELRDVAALATAMDGARSGERVVEGEYVAPRTPTEEGLAELWAELLGVERVGRNDDFFALHGDSLTAVRMLGRVLSLFGKELPFDAVFDCPILHEMAARIDETPAADQEE